MEDWEFTRLAKEEFKKERSLNAITFAYDGTILNRWYREPEITEPILVYRRNSKKVFWNNLLSSFSHVYLPEQELVTV